MIVQLDGMLKSGGHVHAGDIVEYHGIIAMAVKFIDCKYCCFSGTACLGNWCFGDEVCGLMFTAVEDL